MDPLERLMAKFDITGQQGIPDRPVLEPVTPSAEVREKTASSDPGVKRTTSLSRRSRKPTHRQQLKHALTLNAAHVITHDYLTLSQPVAEGLLLMDRTERKLKLIHSLGELQPLHSYTTEYGNSLVRHVKHKALLAGSIEVDVLSDEIDFDSQLEKAALEDSSGTLQLSQRQATYKAFSTIGSELPLKQHQKASTAVVEDGAPATDAGSVAQPGALIEESMAVERLERLTARITEMESWFESVKAEAANDRQMREQATARMHLLQERLERLQEQLNAQISENQRLRVRLDELMAAEPEPIARAEPTVLRR
mmetsp:Transcript_2479/g.4196  ORF Transcript_2479/g.4196 Transcript_2479/m.4196 type:complete len:310 (-) Transcript_2479:260-1189(-)|eukprot:CAMPEP_0119313864 /NCGR_PEP_ID=MMETSP1333-20130426/30684_1 /TAXON_ID=418940 /ORGANISM="Scyphosphaera apsteinii, Strain RCC1455" /LENGTH=309 /DNA_ID=CAMNT_0007318835 /DNA_START=102 /DNA_END=1031 /DNA_ORIENTATION=+